MPLQRRAAPRAETMIWDGSKWQKALAESATYPNLRVGTFCADRSCTEYNTVSDALTTVHGATYGIACKYGFGGTYWERWRNNTAATVLASATRTTSGASSDQTNFNARGIIVFVKVTAVSGTSPTLDVAVQAKDPTTGYYKDILRIPQFTTTGTLTGVLYPGATDAAALFEAENNVPLPRKWRIGYTIGGTNPSFTFSVGVSYIV